MDGQEVPAADPGQDACPAPDERLPFGAPGQAHDDALAGRPAGFNALFGPVLGQPLVHPVGQPQQGELAQRTEVAQPEVVGQGGIDLVRGVDLAVAQALAEQFRRDVDQIDLVGAAHDVVRHRLRLADVGDGADDVAQGRQMLDVDRGQDIDPGIEEFVDVLPALLVAAARDVGMGVFVHHRGFGGAGQDGVEVHFLELRAPVGQAPGRDDFEARHEGPGVGASVVQGERDGDVLAALAEAVGFLQHLVGLAHSGRGPQEDPQRSTCHVVILSLGDGHGRRGAGLKRRVKEPSGLSAGRWLRLRGLVLSRTEAARCVAWKGHYDHAQPAPGRPLGAAARCRGSLQELAAVRPPGRQGNPSGARGGE